MIAPSGSGLIGSAASCLVSVARVANKFFLRFKIEDVEFTVRDGRAILARLDDPVRARALRPLRGS